MALKDFQKLVFCKRKLISIDKTQKQVAQELGISQKAVSDYILGRMTSKRLDKYFGWNKNNE